MSKTVKRTEKDSAMAKIVRAGKKSILRAQQQQRDRHAFRALQHQLIAGAEYL